MHSSQYAFSQQGVLTASRNSRLSMGQTKERSVGFRSRTSASVSPFGRETCFCQATLSGWSVSCNCARQMKTSYESGWATTKPPSGVTITPVESCPEGDSTDLRKLRGIPVVRLILGLLSKSLSLFVGQSWIQCPSRGVRTRVSLQCWI